ncbi:MAG TPA: MFS transporter [Bacteroidia bacterium]|nr:MFS transporter [Bacteroidia bacterium]
MKNRPLITLITVFFFWGFVAASNTILLSLFKKNFELTQFQSQLVDLAFYMAYAVGALIYFTVSWSKGDPLNKIGYKKGLIIGLIISAVGALGFIPAQMMESYWMMLTALFVIGLGFALQQIVANPYVIALGDPSTGAHRVSLAGGINSFGTTIGPLLLAMAVYGNVSETTTWLETNGSRTEIPVTVERTTGKSEVARAKIIHEGPVNLLEDDYYLLYVNKHVNFFSAVYGSLVDGGKGGIILANETDSATANAVAELKTRFPGARIPILTTSIEEAKRIEAAKQPVLEVKYFGVDAVTVPSLILAGAFLLFALILGLSELPPVTNAEKISGDLGAFRYPQVWLGMLAIFVYVGTEVTIQSNLPEYMRKMFGREPGTTVHFISLYWGSLMIGRWVGALTIFNLKGIVKILMTLIVPLIAFGVILLVNYIKGSPMDELLRYLPFIGIVIAGFFVAAEKPARTMILFGLMAAVMMLAGILLKGEWSTYCFVSGGLFCSVMWPCIFSLSIAGLGKYTSQASSLLIMMILGGALIPPLQGRLADGAVGIHNSYMIPLFGFLYLAWFGYAVKKTLQKQGINYDTSVGGD